MTDLLRQLEQIEQSLRDGTYCPGPWKRFLDEANRRPPDERAAIADTVDRVSDLLHQRERRMTLPLVAGVGAEVAAAGLGAAALVGADAAQCNLLGIASLGLLAASFQPLVKMGVGLALGIRYSYAFMWGPEPRFKMRYGTYLAASRRHRALVHLAGCVGSPLAAFIVARRLRSRLPIVSAIAAIAGWSMVASNTTFFIAALGGEQKVGPVPVSASSGGALALELRSGP